jgi:hypothetical protein
MEEKELTVKETESLRTLQWKVVEAQEEFKSLLNKIGIAHKCDLRSEGWNLAPDCRRIVRVK